MAVKEKITLPELPKHIRQPNPEVYLSDSYIVFDLETTNRDKGSALERANRIILNTWTVGPTHPLAGRYRGVQFDFGPGLSNRFIEALKSASFAVAHNSKFELQWLQREGVDIATIITYDTIIGEYVWLGNRKAKLDLDSICKRYGLGTKISVVKLLISGGVCPSEIPENWLVQYGLQDTRITEALFLLQRDRLRLLGLLPHLYTRCLLTPVLADIERHGMQLDEERVRAEHERATAEYQRAKADLDRYAPTTNWDSPKQIAQLLYDTLKFDEQLRHDGRPDRTEADGRRTDGDTIEALRAVTEDQKGFKEAYARLAKASTDLMYLEKMYACCQENKGILAFQFNQTVAQNHRLSSSGRRYKLQGQNFPRKFKRLFRARYPGWVVSEGDGMGMEFRIGAHLGRDAVALDDIRKKKDVHRATAAVFTDQPEDRVTEDQRQDAKPETFRPMYGSKGQTERQKAYAKYFQGRYKGLFDTQTGWTYEVLKNKQLRTEWGLIFYWPYTSMSKSGYISNTTNIFNYPVSCFATAEIIPIGLIHTWHYMRLMGLNGFLVNTIHDSVIGEIPEYELETFTDIVNRSLTGDTFTYLDRVYGVRLVVPLGVEMKSHKFWTESEEGVTVKSKYEVDPVNFFSNLVSNPH